MIAAFLVAVLIAFCWPVAATAENDPQAAKKHYDEGAALYFEGDYAKAALAFMRAYEALPEPVFLYNIAMSHWRLGNLDRAIDEAEKALSEELDPALHAQITARNTVFHQLKFIDENDWSAPAVADDSEPIEDDVELVESPPPANSSSALRWVGVGTMVAGAGLLAGFTVMELGLQKDISEYEAAAQEGDRARFEELKAEIERRQPISLALLWSGAGLVAVGGTLFVFDLTRNGDTSVSVTPQSLDLRFTW